MVLFQPFKLCGEIDLQGSSKIIFFTETIPAKYAIFKNLITNSFQLKNSGNVMMRGNQNYVAGDN